MADALMAGLGIDFNPPPSPPRNHLIARLQGKDTSRRPLPSAPSLRHAISLDALNLDSRRVRIVENVPDIISERHPVEEDYGSDGDEQYEDGDYDEEAEERADAAMTRSSSYYEHVSRARPTSYHPTYDSFRAPMGGNSMQRPHSMMELSDLYAAQSISPHSFISNGTTSSRSHDSAFSPTEESPPTSASPGSCHSGKASHQPFVAELPSRRIAHVRQASEASIHALEALQRARAAHQAANEFSPPSQPAPAVVDEAALHRQSTLISTSAHPARRQKDLNRLLAPGTALKRKQSTVVLEQAVGKGKARVELDVTLESSLVVEGGMLRGKMEVCIKAGDAVWVSNPKARVVGFEELATQDTRNVFYHHAATIETGGNDAQLPFVGSSTDGEGFVKGKPGSHTFPFSLHLPIGKGAKGPLKCKQGVVRYIVIGSMKLKAANGGDRSIAHFYRHVDVFPYLNPAVVLASSLKPVTQTTEKALFMGGNGKVYLTASLHRPNWVAGQRCYVDVAVRNETAKKIKSLSFTLVRTTSVYRPSSRAEDGQDQDGGEVNTSRKKVAEETLEMGKKGGAKGGVTAKGMWVGVDKGESVEFSHPLLVPADALTITRGRHLEVAYELKVTIGAGPLSSDVSADIPIRIINFVSLDPPPGHVVEELASPAVEQAPAMSSHDPRAIARSWSIDELRTASRQATRPAPELDRMVSMDSLRLSDLNALYGEGNLHRVGSIDSSSAASSSGMSRLPSMPVNSIAEQVVEMSKDRQLKHQLSLDCIGSAIASATARRLGGQPSRSALREVVMADDEEDDEEVPPPVPAMPLNYYTGPLEPGAVQLDELDEVPDEYAEASLSDYEDAYEEDEVVDDVYEEESVVDESGDEIDAVLQTRAFDEGDDAVPTFSLTAPLSPPSRRVISPTSPRRTVVPESPRRTVVAKVPTSPTRSASPVKSPRKASFATATSPVKAPALVSQISSSSLRRQARVDSPTKRRPAPLVLEPKRTTTTGPRAMPSPAKRPVFVQHHSEEAPELEGHHSGGSASSSPSTEDATTPPSLTPPFSTTVITSPRRRGVLASPVRATTTTAKTAAGVRSKVTALENRSQALRSVSVGGGLARHASMVSNASSGFGGVDVGRAPSMSFKAPLFRRA